MAWATPFLLLLKLSEKEKNPKPVTMVTCKWPATIGSRNKNYKTLAHRSVATTEAGSTESSLSTGWQFWSQSNIDGELY